MVRNKSKQETRDSVQKTEVIFNTVHLEMFVCIYIRWWFYQWNLSYSVI